MLACYLSEPCKFAVQFCTLGLALCAELGVKNTPMCNKVLHIYFTYRRESAKMTPKLFTSMRKEAGMTQAELARELDVSRRTIINWEGATFDIPGNIAEQMRALCSSPKEAAPVTPKSHPEFYTPTGYKNEFRRNASHPHWFVTCTQLHYHMEDAQVEALKAIATSTADIGAMVWTPERAIVFIMQFNRTHDRSSHMSRERAEAIARNVGFDVPERADPLADYKRDRAQFLRDHPGEGWRLFEDLYPQHREAHEAAPAGELDPDIKAAFEAAFSLNRNHERLNP